jgi:DNA-binding CsgD family transcriptional regulator
LSLSPVIDRVLVAGELIGSPREHYGLSEREDQILGLIWIGLTETEMAHELSLSESSVRQYKRRLQQKVGAQRPSEIIRRAFEGLPSITIEYSARRQN